MSIPRNIENGLVEKASRLTGIKEKSSLIQYGLKSWIALTVSIIWWYRRSLYNLK
jgi:putative antitoxin of VapBC-like toxin-antitoxin system